MLKSKDKTDIIAGKSFQDYIELFDEDGTEITSGSVFYTLLSYPTKEVVVESKNSSYNGTEGAWSISFNTQETLGLLEAGLQSRLKSNVAMINIFIASPYNNLVEVELRVGKTIAGEVIS